MTPLDVTGTLETTALSPGEDPRSQAVIPAAASTEYERVVSGGWWGTVIMVAGVLTTSSSTIVELVTGLDAKAGQVVGVVLAVIGALYKAAIERAYILGRSQVKVATAKGAADVAVAEAKRDTPPAGGTP